MAYVDGYILPVPQDRLADYKKIATLAGKVWRDHGALQYWECAAEDIDVKFGKPFTKAVKMKPGETVIFAWVVFKSRKHRDSVNAKVMKDPRLANMDAKSCPFDAKRMHYGGFTPIVKF